MRTKVDPRLVENDLLPTNIDRLLRGLALTDEFADTRNPLVRLFTPAHFAWQTGWMTANGTARPFVQIFGPVPLLEKAQARLADRFVVMRTEKGFTERPRKTQFTTVLISGRRDPSA